MEGCCRLIGFHHRSVLKELLVLIATKNKFNKSEIEMIANYLFRVCFLAPEIENTGVPSGWMRMALLCLELE
jgi:hypothetical protein